MPSTVRSSTKIIDGQQTVNFEELHLLTPGISWSPDGKRIAIAAKAGEADAILLIDVRSGETEKLTFQSGRYLLGRLVAEGRRPRVHRQHDAPVRHLRLQFASKALTNLTDDVFSDEQPSWSADGKTVYYASDRGGRLNGRAGHGQGCPPASDGPVQCRHGDKEHPAADGVGRERRDVAGRLSRRQEAAVRVGPQRHQQHLRPWIWTLSRRVR